MAYRDAGGKQQTAMIGPYPLIGLKDARERRDELRLKSVNGEGLKSKAKPSIILDKAIAEYWAGCNDISDGYKMNALRALEM